MRRQAFPFHQTEVDDSSLSDRGLERCSLPEIPQGDLAGHLKAARIEMTPLLDMV